MVTASKIGYGTTLEWGDNGGLITIVELTRIGTVTLSVAKVDATTLASPNSYRDILPGLIDPGDVAIEGLFRPDDPGQFALMTDMNSRTKRDFKISFPTALSTTTWTGKAYITGFTAGDATPEGIIPFSATMSIVGKPSLNVTPSTGMATCTIVDSAAGTPVFVPVFAIGTFVYAIAVANTITWVKLQPTAAGHTITIVNSFDGSSQTVTSGDLSAALTLGDVDTITTLTVTVKEGLASPKIYTIRIARAA